MKDYYKILGVSSKAGEDEIRKAYRRLALRYHPDHNPGDPQSEEHFKEIGEAYGVLADPAKRKEYNLWLGAGTREKASRGAFRYSQEEILRDLFRDPRFNAVFQELNREFRKAGFRSDRRFMNQTFFGDRGFIFGGVFFFGPVGSVFRGMGGPEERSHVAHHEVPQIKPLDFLKRLGRKVGGYLTGERKALQQVASASNAGGEDLSYHLTLNREDARKGTWVKIALDRGEGRETLKVRIPPGTHAGARLRLKGKGKQRGDGAGDLYLLVDLS